MADLDADVYLLAEINRADMITTISKALPGHVHVPSPVGHNDAWYRRGLFTPTREHVEYPLVAYQKRSALVMHFDVPGWPRLAFVNTHLPSGNQTEREAAGRQLVRLLADVDDLIVLAGDFNNSSEYAAGPRAQLLKTGWRDLRKQTKVTNAVYSQHHWPGNTKPFKPVKGDEWLGDIWTLPAGLPIGGGLVDLVAGLSDHQPLITIIDKP